MQRNRLRPLFFVVLWVIVSAFFAQTLFAHESEKGNMVRTSEEYSSEFEESDYGVVIDVRRYKTCWLSGCHKYTVVTFKSCKTGKSVDLGEGWLIYVDNKIHGLNKCCEGCDYEHFKPHRHPHQQ